MNFIHILFPVAATSNVLSIYYIIFLFNCSSQPVFDFRSKRVKGSDYPWYFILFFNQSYWGLGMYTYA